MNISIYKRQNEIDYFIHKDAEGFLKEQFDIYVYNWLFNDLDTDFDAATVKRIQNTHIKMSAHRHLILEDNDDCVERGSRRGSGERSEAGPGGERGTVASHADLGSS